MALAGLCCSRVAISAPTEISETIPLKSVLSIVIQNHSETESTPQAMSTLHWTTMLADQVQRLGFLSGIDDTVRIWIDVASAVSEATTAPFVASLWNVQALERQDGGHELKSLCAGVLMRTGDDTVSIEQRIQHLLTSYANSQESTLAQRSYGGSTYTELRDRRNPHWAVITWGRVGTFYLVTLGTDARKRIQDTLDARSPSLGADPWFRSALADTGGHHCGVYWYLGFDRLRKQTDSSFNRKLSASLAPLGLAHAERGLWTLGKKGRSVEWHSKVRRKGKDTAHVIAGEALRGTLLQPSIPADATAFAVIDCNPATALQAARTSYLATRAPRPRHQKKSFWDEVEKDSGIDVQRELYSHLQRPLVIHNFPRHPLRLPLALTLLLPTDGQRKTLQDNIDRLLGTAARKIEEQSLVKLERADDGIWFLQFGLQGPAVGVTNRWVVVSFSPDAVRRNIDWLKNQQATPKDNSTPSTHR